MMKSNEAPAREPSWKAREPRVRNPVTAEARREQNRQSAAASRKRKAAELDCLRDEVPRLKNENAELRKALHAARAELQEARIQTGARTPAPTGSDKSTMSAKAASPDVGSRTSRSPSPPAVLRCDDEEFLRIAESLGLL